MLNSISVLQFMQWTTVYRPFVGLIRLNTVCCFALMMFAIGATPGAAQFENGKWQFNWNKSASTGTNTSVRATDTRSKELREKQNAKLNKALRFDELLLSEATVRGLQLAVQRYRGYVNKGGWPKIDKRKSRWIRAGVKDDRIPALRRRLAVSGDYRGGGSNSWTYDAKTVEALKRFQIRHGLRPTGVVDHRTTSALNVSASERLEQLRLNLIRLYAFIDKVANYERYVVVNIPAFELQAVRDSRVELLSEVIVGKPQTQTPVIEAMIKGLNFFPYWRVPDSIARRSLIPTLIKDPKYLEREQIRVLQDWGGEEVNPRTIDWRSQEPLNYKFRQDPGDKNALGLLRINMPNKEIVYMHDTPMKKLFGRRARAFSAGCVRVKRVFDLATWLATEEEGWNRARIDSVLIGGQAEDVKFAKHVPVLFVYLTSWANEVGHAYFRPDYYDRDNTGARLAALEDEELPKQALSP